MKLNIANADPDEDKNLRLIGGKCKQGGSMKKILSFFVGIGKAFFDVFYGEYSHSKNRYK